MLKPFWLLFVFLSVYSHAQYSRWANDVSLYWGATYRFDKKFYHSFDLAYEKYHSSCTRASFKAYALRLDNFNNSNYAISVKYSKSFVRRPELLATPYFGFSPVVFSMNKHIGLNMKPELGIRFNSGDFSRLQPIGISINVAYGYDIPIIEEKAFTPGRHDISAKVALTFNLHDIRYMRREKRSAEPDTNKVEGK